MKTLNAPHLRRVNADQSGYTIVELMVAITLGMLITAALAGIFINNSRTRNEIERASQEIENGRYAVQLLTDDFRNAGYFAELNPSSFATPGAKPDPCATDLSSLTNALPVAVQGYDNGANAPTCISDVKSGTDIVVIRRASTCAIGSPNCDAQVNGVPYLQTSGCNSATELASGDVTNYYRLDTNAANLTLHKVDCSTTASIYRYVTNIYFVANNDKSGDGIPTLKRAELGASGPSVVPLVEGIENLQLEYGLDTATPTSGVPAAFTADPDTYKTCAPADCVNYWRNTVAVKIHVLARNLAASAGYKNSATYDFGLNADGSANTVGPFNDAYKRHLYESVVRLNNVAGRNTP